MNECVSLKENLKLKEYVERSRKLQVENQDKVKVVLGELGSLIDSINKNYVHKDKFEQLANEVKVNLNLALQIQIKMIPKLKLLRQKKLHQRTVLLY